MRRRSEPAVEAEREINNLLTRWQNRVSYLQHTVDWTRRTKRVEESPEIVEAREEMNEARRAIVALLSPIVIDEIEQADYVERLRSLQDSADNAAQWMTLTLDQQAREAREAGNLDLYQTLSKVRHDLVGVLLQAHVTASVGIKLLADEKS